MPFADTSSPNSPPLFKASLDLRLLSISVVFKSSSQPSGPTPAHRKAHLSTFFNMIHLLRPTPLSAKHHLIPSSLVRLSSMNSIGSAHAQHPAPRKLFAREHYR
jgi:hypothetical protein